MRIVPNLNEITECPNCGSIHLYTVEDRYVFSKYYKCGDCGEEIREGNIITDNSTLSIPCGIAEAQTIKIDNEATARGDQEEKDKFLFNLREEIDRLRYNIHDTHSMMLVNKLTDIFNLIVDYIEGH